MWGNFVCPESPVLNLPESPGTMALPRTLICQLNLGLGCCELLHSLFQVLQYIFHQHLRCVAYNVRCVWLPLNIEARLVSRSDLRITEFAEMNGFFTPGPILSPITFNKI